MRNNVQSGGHAIPFTTCERFFYGRWLVRDKAQDLQQRHRGDRPHIILTQQSTIWDRKCKSQASLGTHDGNAVLITEAASSKFLAGSGEGAVPLLKSWLDRWLVGSIAGSIGC